MSNPCICVNDVTVSMKLFLLEVEIWVEKQLWTLAPAIRWTSIKEEFRYLKWLLNGGHQVTASFMNSSRIRISSVLMPEGEHVTGFNVPAPLRVRFGQLLLMLLLINRFPVSLKHVRWKDFSWS